MTYTTAAKVRSVFGFSSNDASDAVIAELIGYVDKEVEHITGTTWAGTETYYAIVQEAAALLVGSLVYKRFRDKQAVSEALWHEGEAKLRALVRRPKIRASEYEVIGRGSPGSREP